MRELIYSNGTTVHYVGNPVQALVHSQGFRISVFFLLHIPIAFLMSADSSISTIHAVSTLVAGLMLALIEKRLQRVAYIVAYIAGSEVLWRMTGATVFWEFGKYAGALVLIVCMLRTRNLRGPLLPLIYFVVLLPSAILTLHMLDLHDARMQLSFNLSGPFALLVCSWFFSHLKLSREQGYRIFFAFAGPIVGVAFLTVFGMVRAEEIYFTAGSNPVTSGGFGPNQVSAMLGLGPFLLFLYLLKGRGRKGFKIVLLGTMVFFAIQSALTFSRGGLFMASMSAVIASVYLFKDKRSRINSIVIIGLLVVLSHYFVFPKLEAFTEGTFSSRFTDVDPTGRDRIAREDLQIWVANPILGIGPGMALTYRTFFRQPVAAHTEFTRLLAEHGGFGLLAMVLLIISGWRNFKRVQEAESKAMVASLIGWSFLFMLIDAMRLLAPSFFFGLTFAIVIEDQYRRIELMKA